MIRHVVLWKMQPEQGGELDPLLVELRSMATEIEEIRGLGAGRTIEGSSFDAVLTVDVEDQAALDRYAKNPVHEAVGARLVALAAGIEVADFNSDD